MESVVCCHLYWLITGSNNVWTVDKNSKENSSLLNLKKTFINAKKSNMFSASVPFVIFASKSPIDKLADGCWVMNVIQNNNEWTL